MASVSEGKQQGTKSAIDAETALARIRDRGDRIAERESEQALSRLRTGGSLSEQEEEAVATLAQRLTDQLLDVPEGALREADDERTVRVALELLGE